MIRPLALVVLALMLLAPTTALALTGGGRYVEQGACITSIATGTGVKTCDLLLEVQFGVVSCSGMAATPCVVDVLVTGWMSSLVPASTLAVRNTNHGPGACAAPPIGATTTVVCTFETRLTTAPIAANGHTWIGFLAHGSHAAFETVFTERSQGYAFVDLQVAKDHTGRGGVR